MTDIEVYGSASILGVASGLRTFSGPALMSQVAHSGLLPLEVPGLNFMKHAASAQSSVLLALGEIVADKLPSAGSRLKVGPLIGRALAGGFSGGSFAASKRRSVYVGAIAGTLTALGAAYLGYHLRRFINKKLHVPDLVVALAEDAVVVACAGHVLSRLQASRDTA